MLDAGILCDTPVNRRKNLQHLRLGIVSFYCCKLDEKFDT